MDAPLLREDKMGGKSSQLLVVKDKICAKIILYQGR